MDLITDLPPVEGYDSILVVVDQGLSRLKRMLQSMLQEQYSLGWTPMATDTPSPLFQKPFPQPNEIMKFMIEYYWLLFEHLKNGVIIFKEGCGVCQQFKIDRTPSKPAYFPTEGETSTRPFTNCSMDFITDLPPAEGYDSILVVVDQGLSKGVILLPCNKKEPNLRSR